MAAARPLGDADGTMLRHICVAWDDSPPAGWALGFAAELARVTAARLTVAHVTAPGDEPLVDLADAGRARRLLPAAVSELPPDLAVRTRVLAGRAPEQLLALVHAERADLLVAGTRPLRGVSRLVGGRVRHALLAAAPCPVVLVRRPPLASRMRGGQVVLVGRDRRATATATALADDLRTGVARVPASGHGWRRHHPVLAVVGHERAHGLRRRLGTSRTDAVIEGADCPVLVAPIVSGMPSSRPRSLLWQLFAAEAIVLLGALLVLVVAPIKVSSSVVMTEVLILTGGLAVMLSVHLVVLRRTLAPLRLLTNVVEHLDARDPGRLPVMEARTAEVSALAEAFNELLDRLDSERRRSARRALVAQEEERLRIAREMHDQLGQTLTALTIQAERGAASGGAVDRAQLERIAQTALQSLEDVRRIGRELRPEALDDLGLGNALIALCRRVAAPGGTRVTHELEPGLALAPEVELVIYRIAQEAITNALRHAQASEVHVRLRRLGQAVELTVVDDGVGLPAELPGDTAGLSGMRERAALVGAELRVGPGVRGGTRVRLSLPL